MQTVNHQLLPLYYTNPPLKWHQNVQIGLLYQHLEFYTDSWESSQSNNPTHFQFYWPWANVKAIYSGIKWERLIVPTTLPYMNKSGCKIPFLCPNIWSFQTHRWPSARWTNIMSNKHMLFIWVKKQVNQSESNWNVSFWFWGTCFSVYLP